MNFLLFLATFVLFFILTPGVLFFLPPKGSKLVTALVHALIFAVIWTLFTEGVKADYKEGYHDIIGAEYPATYKPPHEASGYGEESWVREKPKHEASGYGEEGWAAGGDLLGSSDPYVDMATKKLGHYYHGIE